MTWQIMPRFESYEQARREFEWALPDRYNPATDFLRKHDDPERVALRYENPDGPSANLTFRDLDDRSDRLAAALAALGIEAGDRVGVVVPQKPENPVTHLANWKLGAVSVPLTVLFGRDALEYRLVDSEAKAVVVDPAVRDEIDAISDACPDLEHVVELGSNVEGDAHAFDDLVASEKPGIDVYDSTPETPSAIMYTSGSTGPPKGVLHSHALWLGRAAAAYNYFDQGLHDATLWTPADWAWGAALGGTLFAALHHGCTIVGWPREDFDPEDVFDFMARHGVTKAFMPPTALRMLMSVENPTEKYDLALETLAAVGEPLTPEILDWVDETFDDVPVNEFYGQTELNLVVGNSSNWFEAQPGSMGKPLPGYDVAVVDQETRERLPTGEPGELAVRPDDDRVFFDEYWGLPEKTANKRLDGDWFLTDDIVMQDDEGYLWFVSRADDVILTSGYRVGPMEVEKAILRHPNVEQAGVVGVPDETRGEAIQAYVQPTSDAFDEETLRTEIEDLVRDRLAAYEYPRHIEFVDELPTTSTGKIRRLDLREESEK
ncbi:acyl-CoA synthetase [Haloprofundus sp. MHR1]|uniref:acyl-CoA synthetase n=1 Tax=Haloprofundus sp. MHR1 TaxID=2572921 RepID=UPI0010BE23E1|nr:AMP-binding protein [Haloprofundus sp. MHR1]QCJ45884.1 AMP-dependent synthetase [Haloprofundus sp. MHR1]